MVIILCGKSGSGKDAIASALSEFDGVKRIVSSTSRPMREGETDGKEYNFLSKEAFNEKVQNGDFIEYRLYDTLVGGNPDTWGYGTEKFKASEEVLVAIKDLKGAKKIKDYCDEIDEPCMCVLITCPDRIRKERAMKRGSFDETEWERRLAADKEDFSAKKISAVIDYDIVNDGTWLPGGLAGHIYRMSKEFEKEDELPFGIE